MKTSTNLSSIFTLFRGLMLAALFLSPWGLIAHAEEGASFGLRPVRYDPNVPATQSYFIYDATPGQTIRDEVQVTNTGSATGTVRLYAADAQTAATSGAVYGSADDPGQKVGSWITLDAQEVTLAPGEERVVGFTIVIPADIRPGQHLGGLVAQDTEVTRGSEGGVLQINMQTRVVTAVQINIPGETIEKLSITSLTPEVQGAYQILTMGLRNEGTEMVKAQGTLTVFDSQNQEIRRQSLQINTLLPDADIQYPIPVERQALSAGEYRAIVELTYGQQGQVSHEASFEVTNRQVEQLYEAQEQQLPDRPTSASLMDRMLRWPVLATFAIGLILLGIVVVNFMRRPRKA